MFNHEPKGWNCPFCRLLAGDDSGLNSKTDLVCSTGRASALVAPHWYPNNPGPVLVVPDAHIENLYDLPSVDGHAVHDLVQQIAVAMRCSYGCDGVSTRQHNEPAGGQDVWHYHVHVLPRHHNDDLYESARNPEPAPREDRATHAAKLRAALP